MVLATGGRDGGHPWRNHILPLSAGSHRVGEKSSCKQYCIANLRAEVTTVWSGVWKMNEPKGDLPPISCHPQKKQGLYLVFPSVHQLTTLLCWKPSNGFPLHLEKKNPNSFPWLARCSLLRSLLFLQPHFPHLFPTSLPLPLPHLHVLASSHLPGLCSHASCSELRGTFREHPMWKPPSRHLCLTVVSLSFPVPFIRIQNDSLLTGWLSHWDLNLKRTVVVSFTTLPQPGTWQALHKYVLVNTLA